MSKTFLLGLSGAFDVNALANCSADFIVYTGNAAGGANQQDIVAFKGRVAAKQGPSSHNRSSMAVGERAVNARVVRPTPGNCHRREREWLFHG
jgi:hypothetical protein